jgi:hypothetical protein
MQLLGQSTVATPVKTADPVLSGDARDGSTLSVSQGSWSGSPTSIAYAWVRCDKNGNACSTAGVGTSFVLTTADVGHTLKATVTATNASGSTSAFVLSSVVVARAPVNDTPPAVAGKALFGATLTVSAGTWTGSAPLTYAYQWQSSADGVTWSNTGSVSATYVAGPSVAGRVVRVAVTATNAAGSSTAYSAATDSIAAPPANTAAPKLSTASVRVGTTITTTPGSWTASPVPTYTYQWQYSATCASWTNIAGETASSYVVTRGRERLPAGRRDGAQHGSRSSRCVRVDGARPRSAGDRCRAGAHGDATAQDRHPLISAGVGTWTASPTPIFTYAWQYSTDGVHWTTIPAAVSTRFTVTAAYLGKVVRIAVTATNGLGSATAYSAAIGKPSA